MTRSQYDEERIPDSGILTVVGQRGVILFTQTFANIQRSMEASYGCEVKASFYEGGHFAGTRSALVLLKEWEERGMAFLEKWSEFYSSEGVGWFKVVSISTNDGGYVSGITIKDSFIANGYGKSDKPICHFLCGFFSAVLECVLKQHATCEETECVSSGHKHCQFVFDAVK